MDSRVTGFSVSLVLVVALLLAILLPGADLISMSVERKHQIFDLCYNRQRSIGQTTPLINGQNSPPLAASVENLIALIEKIENSTTTRTIQAKDLAATLLRKFRSDGNAVRAYSYLEQDDSYTKADKIEDILLDSPAEVNLDDALILTENERCSLYYMLSYQINQTEKTDSRSTQYSTAYRAPANSRVSGAPRYGNSATYAAVPLTAKPREYGVGSYRSNNEQAISLNRLLLGVIAGQLNSPGVVVRDVITKLNPEATSIKANVDDVINPLMAVTLGNIYALAVDRSEKLLANNIGISGTWNGQNSFCTTEYTLSMDKPSDATLSNIRGGIDGYYIGELTKNLIRTATGSRLRLSQILRYYYDNVGGRVSGSGYCDRPTVTLDDRGFKETATSYLKILSLANDALIEDLFFSKSIEDFWTFFSSALTKAKSIPAEDSEWCSAGQMGGYKSDCETPTDLFVAIDLQSADADKYKNLTARLINNLNLGIYGSSATILSMNKEDNLGGGNAEGQNFRNNLKHLTWASYNKGCTGCAMSNIREDLLGSVINAPSTELYYRMNDTLRDFEMTKWFQLGAPAKPFIIMGGSYTSRNVDQNIRHARYVLKSNHRDVPVLLVTNANENDLTEYISSPSDIVKDQDGLEVMTQELSQKICQIPATFQYPGCRQASSESNSVFEGLITPGRTQYWAMYPEYFLKSYDIVMKFTSSEADIKVCYGRYPKPEESSRCWEAKKNEEVRIDVSNPCKDRDVLTCDPFYFTISVPDQSMSSNNICSDKKCLNARQIKFKFTHSGMACSSAFTLVSTLYLAVICALLSSFYNQLKY